MKNTYKQRSALALLAIFLVGGLGAPLAHQFEHVRVVKHLHGGAASSFIMHPKAGNGDLCSQLLVEERTPAHELNCQLCARLTCKAALEKESRSFRATLTLLSKQVDARYTSRTFDRFSIRGPPGIA